MSVVCLNISKEREKETLDDIFTNMHVKWKKMWFIGSLFLRYVSFSTSFFQEIISAIRRYREWFDKTSVRIVQTVEAKWPLRNKVPFAYMPLREGMPCMYLCFFLPVYTLISTGASTSVVTLRGSHEEASSMSARRR